jgi:hypothetical protein
MKKRHYSPQQKAHALLTLRQHNGDLSLVSHLLAIPTVRSTIGANSWNSAMNRQFRKIIL